MGDPSSQNSAGFKPEFMIPTGHQSENQMFAGLKQRRGRKIGGINI